MGGRYVYLNFYGTPIFFGGVCARYDSGIHFRNPLYHSLDCSAIFEPAINDCAPLRFLYRKIYVKIILLNSLASASLFSRWVAYDNLSDGVQGHTSCLPQR